MSARMSGEEQDESGRNPVILDGPLGSGDRLEGSASPADALPRFDPREVFLRHFDALRAGLEGHPYPGFLIGVAHEDQLDIGWVAASADQIRAAIIGRHSRATIGLPPDSPVAALRHLTLLVRLDGKRPVARLLDLQTEVGMSDPLGRRLEAVRTDGATFLSAGGAVLMLLPSGPDVRLDADPEAAWAGIPPRRWLEARHGYDRLPLPTASGTETVVRTESGPRGCHTRLCREDEIPVGLAEVSALGQSIFVRVSGRALDEGFLIGRYDRCEVGGPEADESLSRVHLLVVRDGSRVIAIDTASTNGTYVNDERVHLVELGDGSLLDLGGVLDLTWRIAN